MNAQQTLPTLEPIIATSLEDIAGVVVKVAIARPDGRTVIVPMSALSEDQVFTRRAQMVWPKPPVKDMDRSGPIYDYENAGYLAAVRDTNRQFSYLLLLDALRLSVSGASEDEKVAELKRKLGHYAFMQLVEASNKLNYVTEEQIAAMARSFRANGEARDQLDAALEADTRPVAAPAAS